MPNRKIIHIDMDSFFVAVEELYDKTLKGKPVAVGGLPNERGVICTASYKAREYGVKSGLSSYKALKLCPKLILLKPNFKRYEEISDKVHSIFEKYSNMIEPLSLDEAFLDVTGSDKFNGSATRIATQIRKDIFEETNLTASAGIAPNKFLAKVASDWKKPNGQFTITPQMVDDFVKKLPVSKIFGVGKVTEKKLFSMGIKTCEDLQKIELPLLLRHFGVWGESLYELSRGIDERPVETEYERKSFSVEYTYPKDLMNIDSCLKEIPGIFEEFMMRFKEHSAQYLIKSIFVKLKFNDFKVTTISKHEFKELKIENFNLLLNEAFKRSNKPVRLIGVGVKIKERGSSLEQLELLL